METGQSTKLNTFALDKSKIYNAKEQIKITDD